MTNIEVEIARKAVNLVQEIATHEEIDKSACIYALLCELKITLPTYFEQALVTYLRYGI